MKIKYKTTYHIKGNYTVYKMTLCSTGLYYFGVASDFEKRKKEHRASKRVRDIGAIVRFAVLLKTTYVSDARALEHELIQATKNDPNCLNIDKISRYNKYCFKVRS